MGRNIGYFAGLSDDKIIRQLLLDLGLNIFPGDVEGYSEGMEWPPTDRPSWGGILTSMDFRELHPYGDPPTRISQAIDPVISWTRSFFESPFMVAGVFHLQTDNKPLEKQVLPHFNAIKRWLTKHWRMRSEDRYFVGPQADEIISRPDVIVRYFPPGVEIERVRPEGLR